MKKFVFSYGLKVLRRLFAFTTYPMYIDRPINSVVWIIFRAIFAPSELPIAIYCAGLETSFFAIGFDCAQQRICPRQLV